MGAPFTATVTREPVAERCPMKSRSKIISPALSVKYTISPANSAILTVSSTRKPFLNSSRKKVLKSSVTRWDETP